MAVKLIANYAKRLGLPGYSSHQFSISVETELTDLGQVQGEATRLYGLLQDAIDREIQNVGFVPGDEYGLENGNGSCPRQIESSNGNSNGNWSCSDKQKELILKLVAEHNLDRNVVEDLALERFGVGVRQLNKLQASGLISELLEIGNTNNGDRGGNQRQPSLKGGGR